MSKPGYCRNNYRRKGEKLESKTPGLAGRSEGNYCCFLGWSL
ncbi:hypothetical protein ENTCAN_07778 [Enterobacter cancerogenus ATCC 35316]|nr:hypothetical protein ENTCAN_07778 [Enterobacter cancerogenus ATCC 35316]